MVFSTSLGLATSIGVIILRTTAIGLLRRLNHSSVVFSIRLSICFCFCLCVMTFIDGGSKFF